MGKSLKKLSDYPKKRLIVLDISECKPKLFFPLQGVSFFFSTSFNNCFLLVSSLLC